MLRLLLVFGLSYVFSVTDVCGTPDYLFSFEAGGWLKLHKTPQPWEEAFVQCHDEGALLASPLNKGLANAIHSQLAQSSVNGQVFLGIHDYYSKGDYVSVEGVPLTDMDIKWAAPGNGPDAGDCLTMTVDGSARYASCKDPLPFVCYRKLDNQTLNECGTFDNEYRLNQKTGSCYKVHREKVSWTRAYKSCSSEGGHLVILNDAEEARIITAMFPPRTDKSDPWERFYIGLVTWGKDRVWTTIHGEKIENVFNKWSSGQPDNYEGIQNRGALIWNGELDDVSAAGVKLTFVCEKSPKSKRFADLPPCSEKVIRLCSLCDESQI
ncbi:hypothetical protein PYW07_017453 [Mythimna separata]|uniref:C-type lectin domain-containing protein n=1 Tax=Mythimna separata TaxID=271217 RepID=A0AAD8DXH5_MYTSE|nr:hypothetical protein PYW07_017453 [Mythimna separata]